MPNEPAIYRMARQFRAAALRRERLAAGEMVRRYGELWQRIDAEIRAVTRVYYEAMASGAATSPSWIFQVERWQTLRTQIEQEMRQYIEYAAPHIRTQQWQAVEAARRESDLLVRAALGTPPPTVGISFVSLPRDAFMDLVGFTQDGSPLSRLLSSLGAEAAETVKRELVSGLGMGLSPREVARNCRGAFGGDLVRSLRVSRTETLRAYREAAVRNYRANSDTVDGWMRICGNDDRTCVVCLEDMGRVHPLDELFEEHPNGRCVQAPHTKSWSEILGEDAAGLEETSQTQPTGEELFAQMSEAQQRDLLGPAKFAAYQAGDLKLADLVGHTQSAAWGPHRTERSLSDILGAEKAANYLNQNRKGSMEWKLAQARASAR